MPDPGGRARLRTDSVYLDFPGREPFARSGSEFLAESRQPLLASYFSTGPDASVYVRVQHDPATTKRMISMTGDVLSDMFQEFLKQHSLWCISIPFSADEFRSAGAEIFNV